MEAPIKVSWIERALQVHRYHVYCLKSFTPTKTHKKWRVKDTAKALDRALGTISEDIRIASWTKTHFATLEKFDTRQEAVEFIKKKEAERELDEV